MLFHYFNYYFNVLIKIKIIIIIIYYLYILIAIISLYYYIIYLHILLYSNIYITYYYLFRPIYLYYFILLYFITSSLQLKKILLFIIINGAKSVRHTIWLVSSKKRFHADNTLYFTDVF